MGNKSGKVSFLVFLCCLGLLEVFGGSHQSVLAGEKTVPPKVPVRWQPPVNVGQSGRRTGNPPKTVQGGSRNGCVNSGDLPLTALIPSSYEGRVGVESPVVYVYIPYESGKGYQAIFSLKTHVNGSDKVLYESKLALPDKAGLMAIPLSKDLALQKGEIYRWRLAVQCDWVGGSDYVEGSLSVESEPISSALLERLQRATPMERAEIYLMQGWWYDAVQQLLILQRDEPNNAEVRALWSDLLENEGLTQLISIQ